MKYLVVLEKGEPSAPPRPGVPVHKVRAANGSESSPPLDRGFELAVRLHHGAAREWKCDSLRFPRFAGHSADAVGAPLGVSLSRIGGLVEVGAISALGRREEHGARVAEGDRKGAMK